MFRRLFPSATLAGMNRSHQCRWFTASEDRRDHNQAHQTSASFQELVNAIQTLKIKPKYLRIVARASSSRRGGREGGENDNSSPRTVIKDAYRQLTQLHHPDVLAKGDTTSNTSSTGSSKEDRQQIQHTRMAEITEAYSTLKQLSDLELRAFVNQLAEEQHLMRQKGTESVAMDAEEYAEYFGGTEPDRTQFKDPRVKSWQKELAQLLEDTATNILTAHFDLPDEEAEIKEKSLEETLLKDMSTIMAEAKKISEKEGILASCDYGTMEADAGRPSSTAEGTMKGSGTGGLVERIVKDKIPGSEDCLLHVAAREGLQVAASFFLGLGADINCVGKSGQTPLYVAVSKEKYNIVELLLTEGANPDLKSATWGIAPIHLAAMKGDELMVDLLVNTGTIGASLAARSKTSAGVKKTALELAVGHGHTHLVPMLIPKALLKSSTKAANPRAIFGSKIAPAAGQQQILDRDSIKKENMIKSLKHRKEWRLRIVGAYLETLTCRKEDLIEL